MPGLKSLTHTLSLIAASIVLGSTTWVLDASAALRVASWNVQILGPQKVKNAATLQVIVNTIKQYDLILIQELRDPTESTATILLNQVNAATNNAYDIAVSNRLGRKLVKEQYVYFYKKSALTVVDRYHYADPEDLFERDPFLVRFRTAQANVKEFFVVPLHPEAASAPQEIGSLIKVYDDAVKRWSIKNGVLMGDWSADCDYFGKNERAINPLRTDPRFRWLIPDEADTTTKNTDCAYDRIVVAGDKLTANAAHAEVRNIQRELKLSPESVVAVSDHYPVEFVIN